MAHRGKWACSIVQYLGILRAPWYMTVRHRAVPRHAGTKGVEGAAAPVAL